MSGVNRNINGIVYTANTETSSHCLKRAITREILHKKNLNVEMKL